MHDLADNYLLMIEPPTRKNPTQIVDDLAHIARRVWRASGRGLTYRGAHQCSCGAWSDNSSWSTPGGRETNSLMAHYVIRHREDVPESEIAKLREEDAKLCVSCGWSKELHGTEHRFTKRKAAR